MAVTLNSYAPFDTGAGANVTEATWRDMMRHMHQGASGVIRGFANEFSVYADSSGMQVKVRTGECWMRGHWGTSTAEKTLPIATAHATFARKDRVVLRADFTNNRIEVDVLTGTAAASPSAPAVSQTSVVWETSLSVVDVPAAVSTISSARPVDNRVYTTAQARYYNSVLQSVPNATFTKVLLNTVDYQSGDVTYNSSSTDYTLLRAGLWTITANLVFLNSGTGSRYLQVYKGLTLIAQANAVPNAGADTVLNCSGQYRFAVNDTIVIWGYQNSGGSLNTNPVNNGINVSMTWVGP
jgi:hypothetical protein